MKIGLIIMAAGSGSRFGGHKLLVKIKDKPIYEYVIDSCKGIKFHQKIIVTSEVDIINYAKRNEFEVVINNKPQFGQGYTINLGMNSLRSLDAVMFLVCDQPFISSATIEGMIKNYKENTILIARNNNRWGNPNIFGKKFFDELKKLSGDVGGKKVVNDNKESLLFFDVDNEVEFSDVDTVQDWIDINKKL